MSCATETECDSVLPRFDTNVMVNCNNNKQQFATFDKVYVGLT